MSQLSIDIADAYDAYAIAPFLRSADKAELRAVTGMQPVHALITSAGRGNALVLTDYGVRIAMFGVEQLTETIGIPWMVATDQLRKHLRFFVRMTPHVIDMMKLKYPDGLVNLVDARNTLHISWLKHFGFQVNPIPTIYGVERRLFHEFMMKGGPSFAPLLQS